MQNFFEFILTISPAVTAGLFGLISIMIQRKEARSKRNSEKMDEILKQIKKNAEASNANAEIIKEFSVAIQDLKGVTEANSEGVKDILRYMLQRFHGEYMVLGYIHSHQLSEYLDIYKAYSALGGNGTGEGWCKEVCDLPVRDDLPIINPYLDLMKKETRKEDRLL